mmetsp:Transcript_40937/g.108168  ORF Transcript_40937/g.108168 Transcript_40937/m.108168 type:complete len:266 (+) Transcript_40937:1061-1858(+)
MALEVAGGEHLPEDLPILVGLEGLLEEGPEVREPVFVLAPLHVGLLGPDVHEPRKGLRGPVSSHLQDVHHVVVDQPHHGEEACGEDLGVQPDHPRAREVRGDEELAHQGLTTAPAAPHVRQPLGVYDPQRRATGRRVRDLDSVRAARHRLERAVRLREEPGIASGEEARQDALPAPRGADDRESVDAGGVDVQAAALLQGYDPILRYGRLQEWPGGKSPRPRGYSAAEVAAGGERKACRPQAAQHGERAKILDWPSSLENLGLAV